MENYQDVVWNILVKNITLTQVHVKIYVTRRHFSSLMPEYYLAYNNGGHFRYQKI